MNADLIKVFLLYSTCLLSCFYFLKSKVKVDGIFFLIVLVAFSTNPLFVAMKGAQSAVYLHDLVMPFVVFIATRRFYKLGFQQKRIYWVLFHLYLTMPLISFFANFAISPSSAQFEKRNLMAYIMLVYRNIGLLGMFVCVLSLPRGRIYYQKYATYVIVGMGVLMLFGLANYTSVLRSSTFEQLLAVNNKQSAMFVDISAFGWGFAGLFRGGVGQVCAALILFAFAAFPLVSGRLKLAALFLSACAFACLLSSFSRAGLIALVVCLSSFGLLYNAKSRVMLPILLISGAFLTMLLAPDAIVNRIETIATYDQGNTRTRVDLWLDSIKVFFTYVKIFLFGVGPTNRQDIAQLVGAYGAHNEYIDSIYRFGIAGLVLLLMLLKRLFFTNFGQKIRDRRLKSIRDFTPSLIVGMAVLGMSQSFLLVDYSGFSGIYLVVFLIALTLRPFDESSKHLKPSRNLKS